MVGIVIVSHSAKLAAGVEELARQMVREPLPIAIAAGIDDPLGPFGTDAMDVYAAIESAYSEDGVIVLMDSGSAVRSAQMAWEFLPQNKRSKVRLCEAPLVEGAIAATVQAAAGASLEKVIAEARGALLGAKGIDSESLPEPEGTIKAASFNLKTDLAAKEIRLTVKNRLGIHARPAAKLAAAANQFQSQIVLKNITTGAIARSAKNINQIATLGILEGDEIAIAASGSDAELALAALQQLIENNFGDRAKSQLDQQAKSQLDQQANSELGEGIDQQAKSEFAPQANSEFGEGIDQQAKCQLDQRIGEQAKSKRQTSTIPSNPEPNKDAEIGEATIEGIGASPGIAIGAAIKYRSALSGRVEGKNDFDKIQNPFDSQCLSALDRADLCQSENPEHEWQQLDLAIQTAERQIQDLTHRSSIPPSSEILDIFQAHLLCLEDPALLERVRELIFDRSLDAVCAWKLAIAEIASSYQSLQDSYLQARATDIKDVGLRVLRSLEGVESETDEMPQAGILIATELAPSEVAQLKPNWEAPGVALTGICMVAGSPTSHSAIIAKMMGIPTVVGAGKELLQLAAGVELALDGETGRVWIEPSSQKRRELEAKQERLEAMEQAIGAEAITRDRHKVLITANIIDASGARFALNCGASGVGLLRTEFLYSERNRPPTEEEQLEAYRAIARILGDRPLVIRTVDIGGDKPIAYINPEPEANPFLGWRGVRQSLDCPELLETQLRAILRASHGQQIKVMFPMVTSVREIRAAKQILAKVQSQLLQAGIPFDKAIEVGIMVETPAAVTMADRLAVEVDFFSIGTNDLSQYAMAADRSNAKVAHLADPLEPAVLRMLRDTIDAAREAGIWTSICGEVASNPIATAILVGLGADELSVTPAAIPALKAEIARLTMAEAKAIASDALL
ncbi:MAG: phosphoenolpyruvate--protein phosphotransferase [Oscillatoria sp. SIO1A7]|nr:phosphoenolpyruvate--protein phosphotransferase [Oscillatoria sp. SIO1A7]